jgi:membrane protein YqaA with SNARE-associated domain
MLFRKYRFKEKEEELEDPEIIRQLRFKNWIVITAIVAIIFYFIAILAGVFPIPFYSYKL